jgi:hypothetical protein
MEILGHSIIHAPIGTVSHRQKQRSPFSLSRERRVISFIYLTIFFMPGGYPVLLMFVALTTKEAVERPIILGSERNSHTEVFGKAREQIADGKEV